MMNSKAQLRKEILSLRNSLTTEEREKMDLRLFGRLMSEPDIKKARCVLTYISCKGEVDTHHIIEELLTRGVTVCVPRVKGDKMDFYIINSMEDTEPGCMGILEPKGGCSRYEPRGGELMLVPGLAFDKSLFRMGYGGGYYDKYIAAHRGLLCIGLAYDLQVMDSIPVDEWDMSLDMIVTEKEVIYD